MEKLEQNFCPFCKEPINKGVSKCPHCEEDIINTEQNQPNLDKQNTKQCPYCGEIIPQVAIKCNYCEELLTPSPTQKLVKSETQKLKPVIIDLKNFLKNDWIKGILLGFSTALVAFILLGGIYLIQYSIIQDSLKKVNSLAQDDLNTIKTKTFQEAVNKVWSKLGSIYKDFENKLNNDNDIDIYSIKTLIIKNSSKLNDIEKIFKIVLSYIKNINLQNNLNQFITLNKEYYEMCKKVIDEGEYPNKSSKEKLNNIAKELQAKYKTIVKIDPTLKKSSINFNFTISSQSLVNKTKLFFATKRDTINYCNKLDSILSRYQSIRNSLGSYCQNISNSTFLEAFKAFRVNLANRQNLLAELDSLYPTDELSNIHYKFINILSDSIYAVSSGYDALNIFFWDREVYLYDLPEWQIFRSYSKSISSRLESLEAEYAATKAYLWKKYRIE